MLPARELWPLLVVVKGGGAPHATPRHLDSHQASASSAAVPSSWGRRPLLTRHTATPTGAHVFGGFVSDPWRSDGRPFGTPKSFLFSLTLDLKIPYHGRRRDADAAAADDDDDDDEARDGGVRRVVCICVKGVATRAVHRDGACRFV